MASDEITTAQPSNLNHDPAVASSPATALLDDDTTTNTRNLTQVEQHSDTPVDPQVEALRAIFPDYDDGLLQSVLQSVAGDQDRALDVLLGMSDPQYNSEVPDSHPQTLSQVDLDEQLARRLLLEEQQQQVLPYEPYARRGHRPQQTQPPASPNDAKDTMTEIQDQISRITETGKKTFDRFYSKVKAKIQEYDKPSNAPELEPPIEQPPRGTGPATSSQRWSYNSAPYQQPSYYDPNPPVSPPPSAVPTTRKLVPTNIPIQGYDVSEQTTGTTFAVKPEAYPESGTSPRTSSGSRLVATIDGGKLGLLPKRPISLMKPRSAEGAQEPKRQDSAESNDANDGLEYAENPFEESHH